MRCSKCGSEVSVTDVACLSCGQPQPVPISVSAPSDHSSHRYYGVGGWLWLFLIGVFLSPFLYAGNVIRGHQLNMNVLAHSFHPYFFYVFYAADTLAGFAVYAYGLFAGIQLWRIRSGAVEHAKRFLFFLFCFRAADFMLGLKWIAVMGAWQSPPVSVSDYLAGDTTLSSLRSAIYIAAWYAYLSRSERIRVTYS